MYLRIIGIVLAAAAILYAAYTVKSWHAAYLEAPSLKKRIETDAIAMQKERDCAKGSSCAVRFDKLVADGTKAVNDAKAEADKQYQAQKKEHEDRAQEQRNNLQRMVKDGQKQVAQLTEQLLHAIATSQSCREWSLQPVLCPLALTIEQPK